MQRRRQHANQNINFDIDAGDDINTVIEKWMGTRGGSEDKFVLGANLLWNVWKMRCKWVFERHPFSADTGKAMVASSTSCTATARQNAPETPNVDTAKQSWSSPAPTVIKFNVNASGGSWISLCSGSGERFGRTSPSGSS